MRGASVVHTAQAPARPGRRELRWRRRYADTWRITWVGGPELPWLLLARSATWRPATDVALVPAACAPGRTADPRSRLCHHSRSSDRARAARARAGSDTWPGMAAVPLAG